MGKRSNGSRGRREKCFVCKIIEKGYLQEIIRSHNEKKQINKLLENLEC